jgi:cobalt-zinc-cadmium resistance protein CzcA
LKRRHKPFTVAELKRLYSSFGTIRHAALILTIMPLAMLGGLLALWSRGMTLNVSSAVGCIALFGVAVQNGVIMVASLNHQRLTTRGLHRAVMVGATQRLRPVLMTATVAALGLSTIPVKFGSCSASGASISNPAAVFAGTGGTLTMLSAVRLIKSRNR